MRLFNYLVAIPFLILMIFISQPYAQTDFFLVSKINEPKIEKMGVDKIWFNPDLSQAVFLRSKSSAISDAKITFIDSNMAHVDGVYYFYNFKKEEIIKWISLNLKVVPTLKTSCSPIIKKTPFNFILSTAHAADEKCQDVATTIPVVKNTSFFENVTSVLNGQAFARLIGCAGDDPKFEKDEPTNLSVEGFGKYLSETWDQVKEVIAFLPKMDLPEDIKEQLTCDAIALGVLIPQNALLGMTGVGAPLAIARMYNAIKRLLKTTKYLGKHAKAKKKEEFERFVESAQRSREKVASQAASAITRAQTVYKNQEMMIRNTQKGIRQILSKGKLTRNQIDELKDWIQAEINLQKDILETAKKLNKTEGNHLILQRIKALEDKVNHRNNPSNPVSIESLYPL